jgi:hypothetical protein
LSGVDKCVSASPVREVEQTEAVLQEQAKDASAKSAACLHVCMGGMGGMGGVKLPDPQSRSAATAELGGRSLPAATDAPQIG